MKVSSISMEQKFHILGEDISMIVLQCLVLISFCSHSYYTFMSTYDSDITIHLLK